MATLNTPISLSNNNANATVVEIVIFQSKPGASSQQLFSAAEQINPILKSMPGFLSRSFGQSQNDQWVDIVYWQNMPEALAAAQQITSVPAMQNFENLMVVKNLTMYHFTIKNQLP